MTIAARRGIGKAAAINDIITSSSIDQRPADGLHEIIVSGPSVEGIDARGPIDGVVTISAADGIIGEMPEKRIIAVAARDRAVGGVEGLDEIIPAGRGVREVKVIELRAAHRLAVTENDLFESMSVIP